MLTPCPNTAYFGWSQNRKIRKIPYLHSRAKRPVEAWYSTDAPHMCSVFRIYGTVWCIRAYLFSCARHRSHSISYVHKRIFLRGDLLWVVKHTWLLKCLLRWAQGILTAEKAHGGLAIQSLHVWSQMCVESLEHTLLHALNINLFDIAPVIFTITWKFRSTLS